MRELGGFSIFGLILSFIISFEVHTQVSWNVYSEGGVFVSPNQNESSANDLLLRLDGNINYLYLNDDVSASLKLKVRPEFYGSNDEFRTLKFKAAGNYFQKEESMNWGIILTGQKNYYYTNNSNFNHSIFMISVNSDWYENEENPISAQLGYAYQTASENVEQNLDLIFIDTKIFTRLFPKNNSGAGIYLERFTIDNKYLSKFTNSLSINKGWRYGPQISFDYLENGIVSIEYRFLFHASQVTEYPSYEHWLRFIAGKIFSERWSIFLLADYYNRRFTLKEEQSVETFLIYNSIDTENKINVKLACEINDGFEVYLKSGYFREKFINQRFNFEGWNVLLGFELSSRY